FKPPAQYIIINGFTIDATAKAGDNPGSNAISIQADNNNINGASFIRFTNIVTKNSLGAGVGVCGVCTSNQFINVSVIGGPSHGYYVIGASNTLIDGGEITGLSGCNALPGQQCTNDESVSIYSGSGNIAAGAIVRNMYIHDNPGAAGIDLQGFQSNIGSNNHNNVAYNNVIYNNGLAGMYVGPGNQAYNNT